MPKIFTDEEREEKRVQMFRAGLDLIKKNGYTHASVEKIAEAAGLGKGTFYNFFSSKEDFMAQLIQHGHKLFWQYVDGLRDEAGKLSEEAMKEILRATAAGDSEVFHSAGYDRMMNDIYKLLFEKVFE